jgi:hypothetical protein
VKAAELLDLRRRSAFLMVLAALLRSEAQPIGDVKRTCYAALRRASGLILLFEGFAVRHCNCSCL